MRSEFVKWNLVRAQQATPVACVAACIATGVQDLYDIDSDDAQQRLINGLSLASAQSQGTSLAAAASETRRLYPHVRCDVRCDASLTELVRSAFDALVILGVDASMIYDVPASRHAVILQATEQGPMAEGNTEIDRLYGETWGWLQGVGGIQMTILDPSPLVDPPSHDIEIAVLDRAYQNGSRLARRGKPAAMLIMPP